ncbi:DNA adenine methylase [Candidatus Woesearchaeota archaeon]|nr:DNA adenine methylase [Candidatus Woesearchaeota archaeon]
MATNFIEFIFSQDGMTRKEIREKVVKKFFEEDPGPAQDATYNRYIYHVENSKDGRILLVRPANLKLGFDFRIDVENKIFHKKSKTPNAPKHIDLFEDLKNKKERDEEYSEVVRTAIIKVINLTDPERLLPTIEDKNIGLSIELILKLSKWFSIEMDIRYWNGWGRKKFVNWLNLMRHYNYNYLTTKNGFKFLNESGKKLTEEKAFEIMNNSSQQLHL